MFPNPLPKPPEVRGRSFLVTKHGMFSGLSIQAYYLRISIPAENFDPKTWQNDPMFVAAFEAGMKSFANYYDIAEITKQYNPKYNTIDIYVFLADKTMPFMSNN